MLTFLGGTPGPRKAGERREKKSALGFEAQVSFLAKVVRGWGPGTPWEPGLPRVKPALGKNTHKYQGKDPAKALS